MGSASAPLVSVARDVGVVEVEEIRVSPVASARSVPSVVRCRTRVVPAMTTMTAAATATAESTTFERRRTPGGTTRQPAVGDQLDHVEAVGG